MYVNKQIVESSDASYLWTEKFALDLIGAYDINPYQRNPPQIMRALTEMSKGHELTLRRETHTTIVGIGGQDPEM